MKKLFCFSAIVSIFFCSALKVESKKNSTQPEPLGTAVSNCGSGKPLWMDKGVKQERSRDVYRSIAESLDSIDSTVPMNINTDELNRKLHQLIGEPTVTCFLTLKPSGRIDNLKFSDNNSDNDIAEQKAATLLKNLNYNRTAQSGNITYRIELPNLIVTTLKK